MTIRQQIMSAVIARLQTITPDNGYGFDLSANVEEWPATNLGPNKVPAAIVSDPGGGMQDAGVSGRLDHQMEIEIELIVKGTPSIVRALAGDVLQAIGTDPTWSGLAVDTTATGVQIAVEQHQHLFSGAQIDLTVMYRTIKWSL